MEWVLKQNSESTSSLLLIYRRTHPPSRTRFVSTRRRSASRANPLDRASTSTFPCRASEAVCQSFFFLLFVFFFRSGKNRSWSLEAYANNARSTAFSPKLNGVHSQGGSGKMATAGGEEERERTITQLHVDAIDVPRSRITDPRESILSPESTRARLHASRVSSRAGVRSCFTRSHVYNTAYAKAQRGPRNICMRPACVCKAPYVRDRDRDC